MLPDRPPQIHDRATRTSIFAAFAIIAAGYLLYSQTLAFHWDEGFHLLAARAIAAGKTPYIDFIFPQAPLNAYWNAGWLRVFEDSWRATHIASTVLLLGSIALTAQYLRARFPDSGWRDAAALIGVILFGLNIFVLEYGPIAQAYAFAMFMTAAAFRASVAAIERPGWAMAAVAGLCAGAAPCSTLLAAAAGPVFLLWILIYNQSGRRGVKLLGFAAGAFVALSPILYLFAKNSRQTWFNLVQYQIAYRRVDWPGATSHDVDVLTSWINRSQDLILGLLALGAIVFIRKSSWERRERAPFLLCLWITLAISFQNGFAHPTFVQYFLPMTPSVTILAALGVYSLAIRLDVVDRPARLIGALTCIFVLGAWRGLFDDRESYTWPRVEQVTKKVEEVTPRAASLLAAEQIYFLTHRPAPPGMEFNFAHKLDFGPARNALLHVIPKKEMEARISARAYDTDAICDDSDEVDRVDGLGLYAQKADFGECTVFWSLKPVGADHK